MPETLFRFKQFSVNQDRCAMKVGTDGVLLGAWVETEHANSILDVGTGTGLVALMLAQKSDALIDAIDIDRSACIQASENFKNSPWNKRLAVHCVSLQHYALLCSMKYDLIVSNPPFYSETFCAAPDARTFARHINITLSFEELIESVHHLLKPDGRFCLIIPFKEGNRFISLAARFGMHASRTTRVLTRKGKEPKRLLLQLGYHPATQKQDELIIQNSDFGFSNEYIQLTRDYYKSLRSHRRN